MTNVFISSTSKDLEEYRKAAHEICLRATEAAVRAERKPLHAAECGCVEIGRLLSSFSALESARPADSTGFAR